MGLDMYIYEVKDGERVAPELLYFRKFSALHAWLQKFAGLKNDEFNCHELEIDTHLLSSLAIACVMGELRNASYFFWGPEWSAEEITEGVKTFLGVCMKALAEGKQIYYMGDF